MNPLTDELPDDVKQELAAIFRAMKAEYLPINVERQTFINRTWHLGIYGKRNFL